MGALVTAAGLLITAAAELSLRAMGLGDPVLYEAHPIYGYRPKPNQKRRRFDGAQITINNLGLRAISDWDANPAGKILFLGDSVTYGGSYVTDTDLFSERVGRALGLQPGNAGVNGWGVENVHALVVEHGFRPANEYVILFIEADFFRGLSVIEDQPFWTHSPHGAIHEAVLHAWWTVRPASGKTWPDAATLLDRAAGKLTATLRVLHGKGYRCHLFISLADGQHQPDPTVSKALAGLTPTYLSAPPGHDGLYHDHHHLSAKGHRVWADAIVAAIRDRGARRP